MNLHEVFAAIESQDFASRVQVESGLNRILRRISRTQPAALLASASKGVPLAQGVLRRAMQLADQAVDIRYENPYDVALTTYLWVLNSTHPRLACVAAEPIAPLLNCWWASKYARNLIQGRNPDATNRTVVGKSATAPSADMSSGRVRDKIIVSGLAPAVVREYGAPKRVGEGVAVTGGLWSTGNFEIAHEGEQGELFRSYRKTAPVADSTNDDTRDESGTISPAEATR